jgi:hypothetical protein
MGERYHEAKEGSEGKRIISDLLGSGISADGA